MVACTQTLLLFVFVFDNLRAHIYYFLKVVVSLDWSCKI